MKELIEPLYLLQAGHSLSCWKVWQSKTFNYARTFEGQLFTKEDVDHLRERLNEIATSCKNHEEIRPVDWEFPAKYGGSPSIGIGYGCTVSFVTVKGVYNGE